MSTFAPSLVLHRRIPFYGPLVILWVAFVSAASLKEVVPYVHWMGTLALLPFLLPALRGVSWKGLELHAISSVLLALSILIVAFNSGTPVYEVLQAGKLALILLLLIPLYASRALDSRFLLWGAEAAAILNVSVALAGLVGISGLFSMMATARFGTFLNSPGSLWRAGCLAFMWSLLQLVFHRGGARYLIIFLASSALMVLDGARTAYLLLGVGGLFVVTIAILEPQSKGRAVVKKLLATGAIVALCGALIVSAVVYGDLEVGFLDRGTEFLQITTQLGAAGLRSADDVRAGALDRVLQVITAHPFVGFGMGTTKSQSPIGPMVVHLSYLQIWADVGILGFLGYIGIHVSALVLALRRFRNRHLYPLSVRLGIYTAIYLLIVWLVSGLFHPVSTEISEWVLFLIAIVVLLVPPKDESHSVVPQPDIRFPGGQT